MLIRWIVCLSVLGCAYMQSAAQGVQGTGAAGARALPSALPAVADAVPPAAADKTRTAAAQGSLSPEEAVTEALQGILEGYRFNKRLLAQDPQDRWLLFTRGANETALIGWTTRGGSEQERLALAPASPMAFGLYRYDGTQIRSVETVGYEIGMILEREPKVLLPTAANNYLILAASAQTMPQVMRVQGPRMVELVCEFYNPLDEIAVMPVPDMGKTFAAKPGGSITVTKEVAVGRSSEPLYTSIGAMGIRQPVTIIVENPLELTVRPEEPQVLTLDVVNAGGAELSGEVIVSLTGSGDSFRLPLQFRSGQRLNTVRIPLNAPLPLPSTITVAIQQSVAQPVRRVYDLAQTGDLQFVPAANFSAAGRDGSLGAYRVEYSGGGSASVRGGVPANTPLPWPSYGALGVVYDLGSKPQGNASGTPAAEAQINIVPSSQASTEILGGPSQIGFWLQGDGSGNLLSLAWSDAAGNEFSSEEQAIDWRGWRYIMLQVPGGSSVEYPLRWASLLRLRAGKGSGSQAGSGSLLANGFCFIYGDNFSRSGYSDPALAQYEQSVTMPAAPAVISEPQIKRGDPIPRTGGGRR